jgi:hypothetical protein
MHNKITKKNRAVRRFVSGDAASLSIPRPFETWQNASLPIDLLNRIATVADAQNPMSLQKRTFPTYPMDLVLFIHAVMFVDYMQKLNYDSLTRKQIKQIKQVAQIAIDLECAINQLEEGARLRLQSANGSLKVTLDGIHKLADATRSAAEPQKEKVSHRPPGSFKHNALHLLIEGLYLRIVVEARGKLTLWQDSVNFCLKGTLPDVLELLRPHLPGILPKKMNFSTLHRALARAKKANSF